MEMTPEGDRSLGTTCGIGYFELIEKANTKCYFFLLCNHGYFPLTC